MPAPKAGVDDGPGSDASRPDAAASPACRLTRTEALVVAVKRYAGPASVVGEAFDYLLRWADVYHVERRGPLVGVYDDPDDPGSRVVAGEAWLPIPADLRDMQSPDTEVAVREVPAEPAAVCEHRGYPDQLGVSMAALMGWIEQQGLGRSHPVHRQVYREAPKGRPDGWVVELQVPVHRPVEGGRATAPAGGS